MATITCETVNTVNARPDRKAQYYDTFQAIAEEIRKGKTVKVRDTSMSRKALKRWLTQVLLSRYLVSPFYLDDATDEHTFYVKKR